MNSSKYTQLLRQGTESSRCNVLMQWSFSAFARIPLVGLSVGRSVRVRRVSVRCRWILSTGSQLVLKLRLILNTHGSFVAPALGVRFQAPAHLKTTPG